MHFGMTSNGGIPWNGAGFARRRANNGLPKRLGHMAGGDAKGHHNAMNSAANTDSFDRGHPPPALITDRAASTRADELGLLIDGAINYAIYMLDPDGRVTIWNRGAERIKGWHESEIVGRHFSAFYPPDEVAVGKPGRDLARAQEHGRVEEESWRLRKDGSEFLASMTITALFDDGGKLRGFGKVVRDITDQKAAEAAIVRREDHLRSILATVPDAMIVVDAAGVIASFSAAAERLFGYSGEEVVGRNLDMLVPTNDRLRSADQVSRHLVDGDDHVVSFARSATGLRHDGSTFPMELAVGETVSGGQRLFTAFIDDLTERRSTERRVRALQAELIEVTRLSAMGSLASTLAHELNQPLTAISNYLEATHELLDRPTPETIAQVRQALDEATIQSLRAGQIVRSLRESIGRGEVEKRVESLRAVIGEAMAWSGTDAHGCDQRVMLELDDRTDAVLVARVQIQQVVVNLIANAVQAMADRSIRELAIYTAAEGDDLVRVTVADTGSGLAADMADRLFQAFATTKAKGLGLGLSICRTIVEEHGGRIWASPRDGGGTAFHFTLMRAPAETRR